MRSTLRDLTYIFDPPHSATHDVKALHAIELSEPLATTTRSAIRGYIGTGLVAQHRKQSDGDLLNAKQKECNTTIDEMRYVIKHTISHFNAWASIIRSLAEKLHTDRIARRRSRSRPRRVQRVTTLRSISQQLLGGKKRPIAVMIVSATLAFCVLGIALSNRYAFDDEFNGPADAPPDPTKWSYDIGNGGWGNDELQSYSDSRQNSFLDGKGHLIIRATKTTDRNSRGRSAGIYYNSARLTTLHHFHQKQGHWEARIQIDSKRGLWPAWWLMGQNYPIVGWPQCGEVDVVEDYGFSRVESSIHAPKRPSGYTTSSATVGISKGFHVYRLDWTAESFTFFVDGVKYATIPSATSDFSFRQPMFMVLNLAVGGRVGNPPPDTQFPIDLVVDYVRVWL